MKKPIVLFSIFILLVACTSRETTKKDLVKSDFDFASKQLTIALSEIEKVKDTVSSDKIIPRTINAAGSIRLVHAGDWTSGFFPGELWYMYEYTQDDKWKANAEKFTLFLENEQFNASNHDVGFRMYCSYGNGYRLTGNEKYRDILIQSAQTLVTRYNKNIGLIRSWDFNQKVWQYPVIIDNMMNLELLFWAAKETEDTTFYNIAFSHAKNTLKNHFRSDYSTYHVVDYDTITGEVRHKHTHQGYADSSAWARGQAWGAYGFTMCYRETNDPSFLNQAEQIISFIFNNPNLPEDLIPYWDYNAPNIPNEPRDVSAATITASALYELCLYNTEKAEQYKKWADTILENLSANYLAHLGEDGCFLLLHSTGHKPGNSEIDVPIVYADYYFLEALLRKQKLEAGI